MTLFGGRCEHFCPELKTLITMTFKRIDVSGSPIYYALLIGLDDVDESKYE